MISSNLSEIGAGVAVKNGKVYYVIDAAQPTTRGEPQAAATSLAGGSVVPTRDPNGIVSPVALSTPDANGDVIHEVKPGQTLWQIAIAYQVRIDEIRSMNGLSGNDIYPGNKLLIKKGVLEPTASLTESPTQVAAPTSTSIPTSTTTHNLAATSTPIVIASTVRANNSMIVKMVIGAIALGMLSGGMIAWLGEGKKK
jgi:LysM repeat protein